MRVFDIHAHIYPDKIVSRVVEALSHAYDGCYVNCDGRLDTLLKLSEEAGITRTAVHAVATNVHQTESINRYILASAKEHPDRLVPFAALHPDDPALPGTIEGIVRKGFRGIKLHPEMQGFLVDEPRAIDMFREIGDSVPVLLHCGDYRCDNSAPKRILRMLYKVPELTLICAHFGGWTLWQKAAEELKGSGVYTDLSSSLFSLPTETSLDIIHSYGADHVFFGTDYPMWNPVSEMRRFQTLPLTEEERSLILWGNYARLFGEA